ncbi:MAG: hypothetical protein AAFU85_22605, partial [Planctomycetota bacterium]
MSRKHALRWLMVSAGMLVLGSLYPFHFGEGRFDDAVAEWASMTRNSKSDLAINLLAGIPLGFLGVLTLAGVGRNAVRLLFASAMTVLLSAALSSMVEIAQHWVPTRVSSCSDTIS